MGNQKCEKIEGLSKGLETKEMFKGIKDFTNKGSETGGCIKSKDGKILFETEKILARWAEYVKELFFESRPDNPVQIGLSGPEIIKSEVENCLKQMASGKAPGIDNISSEALQALDESGIETLTELCNEMYSASYVPADLRTTVFIVLPKKTESCRRRRVSNCKPDVSHTETAAHNNLEKNIRQNKQRGGR